MTPTQTAITQNKLSTAEGPGRKKSPAQAQEGDRKGPPWHPSENVLHAPHAKSPASGGLAFRRLNMAAGKRGLKPSLGSREVLVAMSSIPSPHWSHSDPSPGCPGLVTEGRVHGSSPPRPSILWSHYTLGFQLCYLP